MKQEIKEKLLQKVQWLKTTRNEACSVGDVSTQQSCNYEIKKIAHRLKVDYYSIA